MSGIFIGICFLSATIVTFSRGAGAAFALVYLPALLLFSRVARLSLTGLTDADPAGAAIYGMLLGGLLAGRRPRLRITAVDLVVLLLLCVYVISMVKDSGPYGGVSIVGAMGIKYGFIPYFIVRSSLHHQTAQRQTLTVVIVATFIFCAFALAEMRFWPYLYDAALQSMGLLDPRPVMALRRLGHFRANSSFMHPIDLGLSAGLVFTLIAVLAWRTRVGLRNIWVLSGLSLALIASACGISFTTFVAVGCGLALYTLLARIRHSRRLLPAGIALIIVLGFSISERMNTTPIRERQTGDAEFLGSFQNRQELMHLAWNMASTAGFFGWGSEAPTRAEGPPRTNQLIGRSIDNAYLLITMKYGWLALGLWLALPVSLALVASRSVRRSRDRRQILAILAGSSAVVGTMIGMFTVHFGFVYSQLFMIMLALTVNETQAALRGRRSDPNRAGALRPGPRADAP